MFTKKLITFFWVNKNGQKNLYRICEEDLIEVYIIFIQGYLEYCVPVWNASLTEKDKDDSKNSPQNHPWGRVWRILHEKGMEDTP